MGANRRRSKKKKKKQKEQKKQQQQQQQQQKKEHLQSLAQMLYEIAELGAEADRRSGQTAPPLGGACAPTCAPAPLRKKTYRKN